MKKLYYLVIPMVIGMAFASCKSDTKTAAKTDSVPLIYKASYSSSFAISDSAKNMANVLQSYKDWENDKLTNAPAYFADTVQMDFPSGKSWKMSRDSMVKHFQKYRDSLSSSKIKMVSMISLHSTDKNEDWVTVWYKQVDTFKTGKVDSAFYNDVNQVKNGKITYVTSFMQKTLPMPMAKKK